MSSAQKAETGVSFIAVHKIIHVRITLNELGHTQGPTPLQLDDKTTIGIINDGVNQQYPKPMDIRYIFGFDTKNSKMKLTSTGSQDQK